MKTQDVLELRPLDRYGNWGLRVRAPTIDSSRHMLPRKTTIDTVLNAATEAELAEYFAGRAKMDSGRVWDGIFRPMLDSMDPATRDEVLKNLSAYQPSMSSGAMGLGPS